MTGLGGGRNSYALSLEQGGGGGLAVGEWGGESCKEPELQTGVPSCGSCMHSLRQMTLHQKDVKKPKHSK